MSQDETFLSGSIWSLTPEEKSQNSSLGSNVSTDGLSSEENSGGNASISSTMSSQTEADIEPDWSLRLSDSSEESLDLDESSEEESSDSSEDSTASSVSPPDATDPNDHYLETSLDFSQEQSSIESRANETSPGEEYLYRSQDDLSQDEFGSLTLDGNEREVSTNTAEFYLLISPDFVHNAYQGEDQLISLESSISSPLVFDGEREENPAYQNMELASNYGNKRPSTLLDGPPRKRRAPDDVFGTSELGSSDEIPEYELISLEQDVIMDFEPEPVSNVHREGSASSESHLMSTMEAMDFGNEVCLRKLPRMRRRRLSAERLREINEEWNKFYPDHLLDDSSNIKSPDCGALSVRLALDACLADAEHILTERIPRALRTLKREEKLRDFQQSLSKDLTAMFTFVEGKALELIKQMKESCERLCRLDRVVLPTASLESTVKELVAEVTASASSIERLRVNQEHSVVERSLLASQLEFYQRVLKEIKAQNKRNETELAEIEKSCADLERAVDDAIQMRDKDPSTSKIQRGLDTAQQGCDSLQRELEEVNNQIREKKRILASSNSLRLKKIMNAFREATTEFLTARGITLQSAAVESEPEGPIESSDLQKALKRLAGLLESRKSVSIQTRIAMRHVNDIHRLIKITHDSPTFSAQQESQETVEQNSSEAN